MLPSSVPLFDQSAYLHHRMEYDGYAELAGGIPPPLMNTEQYKERCRLAAWQRRIMMRKILACVITPDLPTREAAMKKLNNQLMTTGLGKVKCKNVIDSSVLSELPYFRIVHHTLLDMMHVTSGVAGSHMVGMVVKGRLAPWKDVAAFRMVEPVEPIYDPSPRRSHLYIPAKKKYDAAKVKYDEAKVKFDQQEKLQSFHQQYQISAHAIKRVEQAYRTIQAPINIAPHSKMPFQQSGQMTAHHWVNFTKVYGKYLFQCMYYTRPNALKGMCYVLDLLTACLSANATAVVKVETKRLVQQLAAEFDELLPSIEKSMMMHLLVFHMPRTIRMWGPARGFWCFPFER